MKSAKALTNKFVEEVWTALQNRPSFLIGYLKSLSLKFHKTTSKIELFLSRPCLEWRAQSLSHIVILKFGDTPNLNTY